MTYDILVEISYEDGAGSATYWLRGYKSKLIAQDCAIREIKAIGHIHEFDAVDENMWATSDDSNPYICISIHEDRP